MIPSRLTSTFILGEDLPMSTGTTEVPPTMPKSNERPTSLSDAIAKLEDVGHSKMQDFKEILEKDYRELRQSLDDLKPYLDELKSSVETEVKKTKKEVESKMEKNPWATLAAVGVLAFIVGWIFGKKHED